MEQNVLIDEIIKLKKAKNALIVAHNYQNLEIHAIADIIGDSYQLSVECQAAKADIILFCGVQFMAETAKLLNPQAKVLLSHAGAGCPMADMAEADDLELYKEHHSKHLVVCYVNSSVGVKALSDVCVTSSNAVNIVKNLPADKPILFVPDKNLGNYVRKQTGRQIDLWEGFCPIHHLNFNLSDALAMKNRFPDHQLIVHPESPEEVVATADFVGSTKALADFADKHDNVIIGTEIGLIKMLQAKHPHKSILPLSEQAICKNMKKTTLESVLATLQGEQNEITISPKIAERALKPIMAMMELAK